MNNCDEMSFVSAVRNIEMYSKCFVQNNNIEIGHKFLITVVTISRYLYDKTNFLIRMIMLNHCGSFFA